MIGCYYLVLLDVVRVLFLQHSNRFSAIKLLGAETRAAQCIEMKRTSSNEFLACSCIYRSRQAPT